jgi:Trypsin-like peptidase domain/Effector-associated domain 1
MALNLPALRQELASLFGEKDDARRVVQDAGLDLAFIEFDGKPVTMWNEILGEARKRQKVEAIIRVASDEYPENEVLMLALAQLPRSIDPSGKLLIDLQRGGISPAVTPSAGSGLERTLREELGYIDVAWWGRVLSQLEGQVCRVELNDASGRMATGFLVSADRLLTNYHVLEPVIKGFAEAAAVRFRFDYKTRPDGRPADGSLVGLAEPQDRGAWLLAYGKYADAEKTSAPDSVPPLADELDYALVRLDRRLGDEVVAADGSRRGWIEIPATQPVLAGLPALLILQHPQTLPLKLAFDTDPRVEIRHGGLRIRYATNTDPGSSGSPVFDKDWKLIAVHHYGDPQFVSPGYNQGVPIGLIRESLLRAGIPL